MDILNLSSFKVLLITVEMALLVFAADGRAQLSPGDLSAGHAELEGVTNCTKCHDSNQGLVAEKCLVCHTALKARIAAQQGLHARPELAECQKCHVEHQGKNFNLVYWKSGEKSFDHLLTGYLLEGAHMKLACRDCHQNKFMKNVDQLKPQAVNPVTTYLGLDRNCRSCHVDEHRGQFAQACTECHTQSAWKPATGFSHDKTTFALTGQHVTVACEKCHLPQLDNTGGSDTLFLKFSQVAHNQCSDCHKDPHQSRLGADCTRCHTTQGWRQVAAGGFDHSKSQFPLLGKHAAVTCDKCHAGGQRTAALKFAACRDCHTDYHKGAFAGRPGNGACEDCHTVNGFSPATYTVARHDSTIFALKGAHLAIPCLACHESDRGEPARFVFTTTQCQACHVDVHKGSLNAIMADSGCTACHSVERWAAITYDHGAKTKFALEGKHASVACDKCHKPSGDAGSAPVFGKLGTQCGICHRDPHYGQFAATDEERSVHAATIGCEKCHSAVSWKAERFNHAQTKFALDGAHSRIPCAGCHKPTAVEGVTFTKYIGTATTCAGCHGSLTPPLRGAS